MIAFGEIGPQLAIGLVNFGYATAVLRRGA